MLDAILPPIVRTMHVDGCVLEYEVRGSGEPVLLIHGSVLADGFAPIVRERALRDYGLVRYRRAGFGGSDRAAPGLTMEQMAGHAAGILRNLALRRAHVVGHSYGAAIALEMARSFAEQVHTLALLEAPLVALVPSGAAFRQGMAPLQEAYLAGKREAVVDGFLASVNGPGYRGHVERALPGALDMAARDIDTLALSDVPAHASWSYGPEDAGRIACPVLLARGSETAPLFRESNEALARWVRRPETVVLQGLSHLLPIQSPRAVAEALAAFFRRHPMAGRA